MVTFGAIRNKRIEFAVVHPDLSARRLLFKVQGQDGLRSLERQWPDDFDVSPVGAGFEGRISLGAASDLSPFSKIVVKGRDSGLYDHGDEFFLQYLYGFTPSECHRCFTRSKWRTPDKETLTFACQQVRDFYFQDAGQRNLVSVIFAYRALDFGDTDLLQQAALWLEAELAGDYDEEHANHKRDATHQRISMGMALWMVYLSLDQFDKVIQTLDDTIAFMRGVAKPSGLHALNGNRMMLMRAYAHILAGQEAQGVDLAHYAFDFYRRCAAVADDEPQTFSEMKQGHHAAWLALVLIKKARQGLAPSPPPAIFDAVHRLKDDVGKERLRVRFSKFLKHIKRSAGDHKPTRITAPAVVGEMEAT